MKWLILILAIILNTVANILIKSGMAGSGEGGLFAIIAKRFFSLPILGGITCFAFALVAYSYVLAKMNMSVAYPIMTGTCFAIICLSSVILFKEPITTMQVFGFVLISLGIWFVAH